MKKENDRYQMRVTWSNGDVSLFGTDTLYTEEEVMKNNEFWAFKDDDGVIHHVVNTSHIREIKFFKNDTKETYGCY